jgi:hypothetical protein
MLDDELAPSLFEFLRRQVRALPNRPGHGAGLSGHEPVATPAPRCR